VITVRRALLRMLGNLKTWVAPPSPATRGQTAEHERWDNEGGH
jgi:hypothetical protein